MCSAQPHPWRIHLCSMNHHYHVFNMEHTPLTNILPVLSDILVIRYSFTQFALYQTDWTELQVQQ